MTPYFLFIFIVATRIFLINSTGVSTAVCGPNEVERTQTNCDESECCPGPEGQPAICPCSPDCQCAPFYLRSKNGTCVEGSQCPPFFCNECENKMYDSCPSPLCSEDCANATPDGQRCRIVGRALFRLMCRPACRCIDNYWRDDERCVPYNECPQFQTNCA